VPRLFLAFPVDGNTRQALLKWQAQLPAAIPGVRWLHADDWHITALFIGNVNEPTAAQIQQTLQGWSVSPPPHLSFDTLTTLYRNHKPAMWWAGYLPSPEWQSFYQSLYELIAPLTPLESYRPNTIPHITLARLKTPYVPIPDQFLSIKLPAFPLAQLQMYASQSQPTGNRYQPLYTLNQYFH
jgi:2'-5' RNA ligase